MAVTYTGEVKQVTQRMQNFVAKEAWAIIFGSGRRKAITTLGGHVVVLLVPYTGDIAQEIQKTPSSDVEVKEINSGFDL